MEIMNLPEHLRPAPKISYPEYTAGHKNIEEYFYHFTTNSVLRTPNSDFIYVPAFWTHYYIQHNFGRDPMPEHDQLMRELIVSNKKYFTVTQYDDGILGNVPPNLTVFSAGNKGQINQHINHPFIPIPLLADGFPSGTIKPQQDRKNLICFAGSLETHPVRKKMAEYFKGKEGVVFAESNLPAKEYADLMQDSIYTLCPRGYGISSFRLYEALKCGSIPLYFVDDNQTWHVPYEPCGKCQGAEPSLKKMMLLFYERDMKPSRVEGDLYTWLGRVTQTGGAQAAFKRICENQHLLTMEHTAKAILEYITKYGKTAIAH